MGRPILKLGENQYIEYSTVSDSPCTYILTEKQLKESLKADTLEEFETEFKKRMKRVKKNGTSFYDSESVGDAIFCNRAGPNETHISLKRLKQIYKSSATWKRAQKEYEKKSRGKWNRLK